MQTQSQAQSIGGLTKPQFILSIGLILLAFALRLQNLEGDSFWVDEIETLRNARLGWEAIQGDHVHPGLYYLITAGVSAIYGESEFSLRLSSLYLGTLAIPLIIVAGRLLGRPSIGLWAALFLALSPFHVRYSQEARMYAQLMTLTLLSFIFLYKALMKPKWPMWAAYIVATVLNLYTHYGSLVVLICQAIPITAWAIARIKKGDRRDLIYPIVSGLAVFVLYLPWLDRFLESLQYNVGAETVTDTGTRQPLINWAKVAYYDFGMSDDRLAILFLGLCLMGFLLWILHRRWRNLAWITAGLLLPLPLIYISQVARGVFSRYLIFMYPFYLLAITFSIDTLMQQFNQRLGRTACITISFAVAAAVLWIGIPKVRAEHDRVSEDWHSIFDYLDQNAADGTPLLALTMNYRKEWNNVSHVMPTYLKQAAQSYYFLDGNHLTTADVAPLLGLEEEAWAVVSSWAPIRLEDESMEVAVFQENYYVIHDKDGNENALESAIKLYEQIIPFAFAPMPQCFLKQDLSLLYLGVQDYWMARHLLDEAAADCPTDENWRQAQTEFHRWLRTEFRHDMQEGDLKKATEAAMLLIEYDNKDQQALELATAVNLWEQYLNGDAIIAQNGAAEPIAAKKFTMPHNGDWGDVIFLHPPAAVSFQVDLPQDPVSLQSRVALDPQSWDWGGDGVTFVATIQVGLAEPVEIIRQYVPNDETGHDWQDVFVSLAPLAGKQVLLTLTTEAGPGSDSTADWAGWETPRLIWEPVRKSDN